jgi:predicted DNA-binding protein with PD1-like motif
MEARRIGTDGRTTYIVVFRNGEEVSGGLAAFAEEHGVEAARITAVGGFREATLGFYDWESRSYREIPVDQQMEVLSFDGNVACDPQGKPKVHVHVVLGRRDGTTMGGHLMRGIVRPTMEVIVDQEPAHLRRVHDEETGLALIDPRE